MLTKQVTSIDVARAAGVSQSSVSRTFSGESVSVSTRDKILKAAERLGYRPNLIASSLSSQRTNIVGIVMTAMDSPFNPYILDMFAQRLQETGLQVLFFDVGPGHDIDDMLPRVLAYQVDALIITSTTLSSAMAETCTRRGMPVFLFNRTEPTANVSAISTDNVAGGRLVADLFLDAEHRHLAYIAGPENTSTNREREQGYTEQLTNRGYGSILREESTHTYESGAQVASRLFQRDDPPDAVFCASDIIALGLLDQARRMNVRIPEDVSIIGFDDIPAASWLAFDLTTIRQPVNHMVDATLELLTHQLGTTNVEPVTKLFSGTLIKRSTARLP